MQVSIETHRLPKSSRLATALRNGLLLGAALLMAPAFAAAEGKAASQAPAKASAAKKATKATPAAKPAAKAKDAKAAAAKAPGKKATAKKQEEIKTGQLADFGKASPPPDVVHVANWVSYTRNNKRNAFVVIDKKDARMYVFEPSGKLKSHAPVLLGKAVGDHTAPGVGNKPLSQIKEHEKTTPAGRFQALPGKNTSGEDIIWIDYNAAVSMHRLRKVAAEERRADRMATADPGDNRISNGCVNVPPSFYNSVLKPAVTKYGAVVYVLPETRTPQQLFGSHDVAVNVPKN